MITVIHGVCRWDEVVNNQENTRFRDGNRVRRRTRNDAAVVEGKVSARWCGSLQKCLCGNSGHLCWWCANEGTAISVIVMHENVAVREGLNQPNRAGERCTSSFGSQSNTALPWSNWMSKWIFHPWSYSGNFLLTMSSLPSPLPLQSDNPWDGFHNGPRCCRSTQTLSSSRTRTLWDVKIKLRPSE